MAANKKLAPVPEPTVGHGSDEPFTFASSLGPITLPSLATAPRPNPMALKDAQVEGDYLTVLWLVLKAAASPETWDVIKRLPGDEFERLSTDLGVHSGISVGELQAS